MGTPIGGMDGGPGPISIMDGGVLDFIFLFLLRHTIQMVDFSIAILVYRSITSKKFDPNAPAQAIVVDMQKQWLPVSMANPLAARNVFLQDKPPRKSGRNMKKHVTLGWK